MQREPLWVVLEVEGRVLVWASEVSVSESSLLLDVEVVVGSKLKLMKVPVVPV